MDETGPVEEKGRYINPHMGDIRRRPTDFLLWMFGFFRDTPFETIPEGFSYPIPEIDLNPKKPTAVWIGHSTFLIQVAGKNFLSDPIWSDRCSPVSFFGPKRKHPPPMPIEQLPGIHYVLISHDHYDHLDAKSVEKLHQRFPDILWIVPSGVKQWFLKREITRVVELNWWDEVDVDSAFKITAVPSQHFSGRKKTNHNNTLWSGYVVEDLLTHKTFYFVGDTGYNPYHFKQVGQKFPSIDLSLIPIGAYSPRKFMAAVHIEPKDAVNIHRDVNSTFSLAMHWKTFRLSEEPMDQPPFDLYMSMKSQNLDTSSFLPIDPGVKVNW